MRLLLPELSRILKDDLEQPDETLAMRIEPTLKCHEDVPYHEDVPCNAAVPCPEDEPLMIRYYDAVHCVHVALKSCRHYEAFWSTDGRLGEDRARLG